MKPQKPIVTRFKKKPILTREDVPYPVATVHNAGVVKHVDRYIMLFRSHLRNGRSIIGRADSEDGLSFKVDPQPFLLPANDGVFAEYEAFGVEDLRICPVEDCYLLTYSAYSRHGVRIALAQTRDFEKVERIALITQADLRNVVIFPETFGGRYVRLDRPHSEISPWSIWISYSPDLIHWGDSRVIMKPAAYHWDEMKIGPGAPPFKTGNGWLHIYHGVFKTMSGSVYRLGAALHALDDPATVIGVSDQWILQPEDPWEINGYVPNVVFSCAAVPENDGTVKIYWAVRTRSCAPARPLSKTWWHSASPIPDRLCRGLLFWLYCLAWMRKPIKALRSMRNTPEFKRKKTSFDIKDKMICVPKSDQKLMLQERRLKS